MIFKQQQQHTSEIPQVRSGKDRIYTELTTTPEVEKLFPRNPRLKNSLIFSF